MTKLNEFGLTTDLILGGEKAEFDAIVLDPKQKKLFKELTAEGRPLTYLDDVDMVIDAYSDDLRSAYLRIQELERELEEQTAYIERLETNANKLVHGSDAADQELYDVERMVESLEHTVAEISEARQADQDLITSLKREKAQFEGIRTDLEERASKFERLVGERDDEVSRLRSELDDNRRELDVISQDVNEVLANLRERLANL